MGFGGGDDNGRFDSRKTTGRQRCTVHLGSRWGIVDVCGNTFVAVVVGGGGGVVVVVDMLNLSIV